MLRRIGFATRNQESRSRRETQMLARIGLAVSLIILIPVLILGHPALAQGGVIVQHTAPYWQASYWNNTSLPGLPVLERQETNLHHDWGSGSPHTSVSTDGFSARWTRYIDVTPGRYRFTATSDDGIRVWVDSELLINDGTIIGSPPTLLRDTWAPATIWSRLNTTRRATWLWQRSPGHRSRILSSTGGESTTITAL